MKVVFVVGFSPAVKQHLDEHCLPFLENRSVVWIAECRGIATDLSKFRELVFTRLASGGVAEVLVLFAVPPDQAWVETQVEGILGRARNQYQTCRIGVDIYRDFGDRTTLLARIRRFDLPIVDILSSERVREKLNNRKVICISATGRTSVKDSLRRAGVPDDVLDDLFDEEIIDTGRNSTLIEHLQGLSRTYDHMLYAWEGLRTASGGLVRAFKKKGIFYEADSAAKLANMMKRFLSGRSE